MTNKIVVGVTLKGDGKGLVGEVRIAQKELDKLAGSTKKTGTAARAAGKGMDVFANKKRRASSEAVRLNKNLKGVHGSLGRIKSLLPTIGLALLIRESVQAAEGWRSMDARIRRATEGLGDYNRVSRELYETSQRNGTVLSETANLFTNINRAAEDIDRSRGDVLQLTDTIQQLGVISGASGEAMKNSMRQFSQAMAGGIVRAEEYNAIIENTPEIAIRIAKGMGMTVGQLRLAVNEGKVLSEDVFDSLLKQAGDIEQDFSKMPLTINRAWTSLTNSMSQLIALGNEASGTTEGVANSIKSISDELDDLNQKVKSGELAAEFQLWSELFDDLDGAIDTVSSKFDNLIPNGVMEFWRAFPAMARVGMTEVIAYVHQWAIDAERRHDLLAVDLAEFWDKVVHKAKYSWLVIKEAGASALDFLSLGATDYSSGIAAEFSALNAELDMNKAKFDDQREAINQSADSAIAISKMIVDQVREEQFARVDNMNAARESARWLGEEQSIYDELMGAIDDETAATRRNTAAKGENADAVKAAAKARLAELSAIAEVEAAGWELGEAAKQVAREQNIARRQSLQERIDDLTQSLETESQAIRREYNERIDLLDQAQAEGIDIIGGYAAQRERIEQQYSQQIVDLYRQEFEEKHQLAAQFIDSLSTGLVRYVRDVAVGEREAKQAAKRSLNERLEDLDESLRKGTISVEDANEQRQKLYEDHYDRINEIEKEAAERLKDTLVDAFLDAIEQMLAAWIKSGLTNLAINITNGNTGGGFWSTIVDSFSKSGGGTSGGDSIITTGAKAAWKKISAAYAAKYGAAAASSYTSAVPGAVGSVKGPAVLNYGASSALGGSSVSTAAGSATGLGGGGPAGYAASSGSGAASGGAAAAGAAIVAAIAVYGFGQLAKSAKRKARRQSEFFDQVGTGTRESLGNGIDYRGQLDDATAFFSASEAGWKSTAEALNKANLLLKSQGSLIDENGNGLWKVQGNIDGIKTALEGATVTSYSFSGSLGLAIEKGNSLRVNIQGDAEVIKQALHAATAAGVGGFRLLQTTGSGVSAQLTGDMQKWNDFLQSTVNSSIAAMTSGLGGSKAEANSLTQAFREMAAAASSVKAPRIAGGGGRAGQVDGSHREGMSFIPFDGYIAQLHYGEEVLTAADRRKYHQMQQMLTALTGTAPSNQHVATGSEDPNLTMSMGESDSNVVLLDIRANTARLASAFEDLVRQRRAVGGN